MGRATRILRMLGGSSLGALALIALGPAAVSLAAEEEKPELVLQGGHTAIVRAVAFSRDGRWLASGSDDSTVKVWEVATGRLVRTFTPKAGDIWAVALDSRGERLASVGYEGPVMIWDTRTGEKLASVKLDGPGAHAAFSVDARWIAHGTSGSEVKVVDLHSGKVLFTFEGAGTLESAAFSGDGHWLATGSDEHAIRLWDLKAGREKGGFALQDSSISAIAINSDGRWLASASGGWLMDKGRHVRIWDTDARTVVRELDQQKDAVYGLALSADGRWVATGDFSGNVRLWDVKSGDKLHDRKEDKGSINSLVFSPDGKSLASASGHLVSSLGAGAARLLDVASWKETQPLANFSTPVSAAAMSRSSRWLAYGSDDNADGSLKLFDVNARKLRSLKGHIMNVLSVAFSPDERLLASGAQWPDDKVILWNVTTGKAVRRLEGHDNAVVGVAFNPSGRLLASASYDKTVRIWDVQSGRAVHVLRDFQKGVHSLAFSADGASLATGVDDGTVTVWNCADWTQRTAFETSSSGVSALAFSPDGRWLAAGGADSLSDGGDLRVWNLRDGGEPAILSDRGVYDLAYSPDGRWLVSAGRDGTLGVWDVDTNLEARTLLGHTARVNSVEFGGSGRVLITASEDGSVRLWDFASGQNTAIMAGASISDDWVVATLAGLFDGSSNASHELLAWHVGNGIYPLDRFFNQYYSPGLLKAILDGERPEPSHAVSALKPPPEVRITSNAPEGDTKRQHIEVTVEAEDRGSGVALLRLYQNNKLVASRPGDSAMVSRKVFAVDLVAGENVLRAVALGRDGVESNERELRLTFSGVTATRPNLYVLAVGINHYEDPRFDLAFARPDAGAVAQFFEGDDRLFASKRIRTIFDKDATREKISRAMGEIAASARAEDVVLVYLAGHGASVGEQFYFLPRDMRSESDEEAAIRRYGVAASTLGDALLSIKALKQVLILDTCESEAALPILAKALIKARSGSQSEEKAVKMLAHAQGIFLIAASTKSQYAFEVPELKHGVLTYALLSGLGEKGETPKAQASLDGIVTMFSLLQYVNEVVPDLTEKYHNGDKQYPVSANSGQDFPIARNARATDPDPAH